MIMIVCLLALMVYFDVRSSRIKNKWIIFLFVTAIILRWKEEGGVGVLYGLLQFVLVLMILLPVFACRMLGAADVKILLALSVYLSFMEMMFLIICSLVTGGLIGLFVLIFSKENKSFHYIHFTIPIFLSFMVYAYGGVYELLLCYL